MLNVEKDYAKSSLKVDFNLQNILIYFFRTIHEKKIVKLADKLIVLTPKLNYALLPLL